MPKGTSLLDYLNAYAARTCMTKDEFGKVMHNPNATEEEKAEALRMMEETGGYENLGD